MAVYVSSRHTLAFALLASLSLFAICCYYTCVAHRSISIRSRSRANVMTWIYLDGVARREQLQTGPGTREQIQSMAQRTVVHSGALDARQKLDELAPCHPFTQQERRRFATSP